MPLRALSLLLLAATLLAGCGGPDPIDPVRPQDGAEMAPLIEALVVETVARVQAAPGSGELHGRLGLVYEANGLHREAAASYANAMSLEPSNPRWALRRGVTLQSLSETAAGEALILEAERRMPESAAVHHRVGYLRLDAGQPEAALASFQVAAALGWSEAQPYIATSIGEALLAMDQPEEALPPLETAIEGAPNHRAAHYAYGMALRQLGRMEEAARELALGLEGKRVIIPDRTDSEMAELRRGFADLLKRAEDEAGEGNFGRSRRTFEELLAAYPGDPIVLNNYAGVLLAQSKWEEGLAFIDEAIAGGSRQFGLFVNRSRALRGLGRLPESRAASEEAIAISPEIFEGHMERARTCLSQGDLVNARESLGEAIELNGEDPTAHLMLAEVSTHLGFPAEACASFERVTELRPSLLPPRVNAAKIYMEAGLLDQAEEALRGAEAIAPDHERVRMLRSSLEARRNGIVR